MTCFKTRLESKHLILQLADRPSLLEAQRLRRLLQPTNHRGRAAQQNLDITRRLRQQLLHHLLRDKADTSGPALRRAIEDVMNPDTLVLSHQRIQVFLQENVLRSNVGENEIDLGAIARGAAPDNGADDLQHGRDAGTAGDHAKVTDHVGGVDKGALGTLDADGLADLQRGHVLGDVAGRVGLDEQVEVAGLVVARDRGVGTHNLLGGTVGLLDGGADGDVLADGQAEDGVGSGELEAVAVAKGGDC